MTLTDLLCYKLKVMKDSGHKVYLIFAYDYKTDDDNFKKNASDLVDGYFSYPRVRNLLNIFLFTPYFLLSYAPSSSVKIRVSEFLDSKKIDCVILDHLNGYFMASYIRKKLPIAKFIYRMHNNECAFWFSMFKNSGFTDKKKWLYFFETIKLVLFEKFYYKKFSHIAAISQKEADDLKRIFPDKRIDWVPPFYNFVSTDVSPNDYEDNAEFSELKIKLVDRKVLLLTGSFYAGFNVNLTV